MKMNYIGHWSYKPKWFHVCFQSQSTSAKGQPHPLTPLELQESYAYPNSPDEEPDYCGGVI